MKIVSLSFLFFVLHSIAFTQHESIEPLSINPELQFKHKKNESVNKTNANTFDSTFIYFSDTLSLPFLDEFSENHFENYQADYADPGVTSDKKYRLLDNSTLQPIPSNQFYTAQPTFRRTFDVSTTSFSDVNFSPLPVKVGDLSTYPVDYQTTNLYPPYYIYDTIGVPDISDTIWITNPEFFQDSATQFFAVLNNPDAFWLDDFAYHNYRFAVQPRTLGVVTFDGLDQNGYPYQIGSTSTNYADFLTSKPLDLQPYTASDSLYFSFLYQAQGLGDIPEQSDSLVLEFYAKDVDQWFRVWSTSGESSSPFKVAHLPIVDQKYFKKGFQFRFKNYGSLSGMLDLFHLDYVHLRPLSGYQDTLFKDFAFVYPVGSLLKTYTSVPWDHFKNNAVGKMNNATQITVHNGSNLPENNQNGEVKIYHDGTLEGSFLLNAQVLSGGNINYGPQTTYISSHDLSGGYVFDVTKPGNYQSFEVTSKATAQFPNFPGNDSTTSVQFFSNYYSYDDGSAEYAYGPTGVQSRLAVKYTAYEPDSLIGVNLYFAPTVNNVSNKLFLLSVWADNNGVPGELLYEDNVFFPRNVQYSSERDKFVTYYFKDTAKVACNSTFYIGWRQFDADRLNVGLDRNLDNSQYTFYSVNNGVTWNQSAISGSVMMRPVFSTSLDEELQISAINPPISAVLYPNPTQDVLTVRLENEEFIGIEIFDLGGKRVLRSSEPTFSTIDLQKGIYFAKINGKGTVFKITKL
jgi:hypothetical protein